jgi:hypothetical protein
MELVSVVTIAVKKGGKIMLVEKGGGRWGFPSAEFDKALNGSLDDIVRRCLLAISPAAQKTRHLGSFLRKEDGRLVVAYNFLIEDLEGDACGSCMLVPKEELGSATLDSGTAGFLESYRDVILG